MKGFGIFRIQIVQSRKLFGYCKFLKKRKISQTMEGPEVIALLFGGLCGKDIGCTDPEILEFQRIFYRRDYFI